MSILWLLGIALLGPVLLFSAVVAISVCLRRFFGIRLMDLRWATRGGNYGRDYLRTMTSGGAALSEQIELDALTRDAETYDEDDHMR